MLPAIHDLINTVDISSLTDHLMTISEQDVDIIGNFQKSFSHFVKSGQVWALGIGVVVGYMFRGFTSY